MRDIRREILIVQKTKTNRRSSKKEKIIGGKQSFFFHSFLIISFLFSASFGVFILFSLIYSIRKLNSKET